MNLHEKPGKLILGGLYRITIDGYLICATRRNTALEGLAMRPSLEYGRLVYRVTINGKTTSIRAFIVVRDAWGEHMHDPGDYKDMVRMIDAHNAAIRKAHHATKKRERDAENNPKTRGMCPYCNKRPLAKNSITKTCHDPECIRLHKRAYERDRMKRKKEPVALPVDKPASGPWAHAMDCPWEKSLFDTAPSLGVSWYGIDADPMTLGAWGCDATTTFKAPVAQEVAA